MGALKDLDGNLEGEKYLCTVTIHYLSGRSV